MKILHQFYQNLSNKYFKGGSLLLLPFLIFPLSNSYADGLYENLKNITKKEQDEYSLSLNKYVNQKFSIDDIQSFQSVKLSQNFLRILAQNIPVKYIKLAKNDQCSLYDLLNTSLVNLESRNLNKVLFNYKDKSGNIKEYALPLNQFLNSIAYKTCPNSKKFANYFKRDNLRKTLENLKISTPSSVEACYDSMATFSKEVTTPYLCNIIEEIKNLKSHRIKLNSTPKSNYSLRSDLQLKIDKAVSYSQILNTSAKDILAGRCNNLDTPKNYCDNYFKKGIWSKLIYNNKYSAPSDYFCQGLSKKECLKTLNTKEGFCLYAGNSKEALFPQPKCSQLAEALSYGRYKTQVNDCPGLTGNDAITSFSRLMGYFENLSIPSKQNCDISSTFPYIKFTEEFTEFNDWQIQTCYNDPVRGNNEYCLPTFFGDIEGFSPSITKVMAEITRRLKGFSGDKCKLLPKSKYRPTFLEYKSGCYILTPEEGCHGTTCELKVILDQVEFKKYKFKGELSFNFFPIDFINESKSIFKVFEKNKKKKTKTIKNISSFLLAYEQHKNGIFMGIGCAEQLLPRFFSMNTLNQCTPTTFLVDGYLKDQEIYALTTKTSFDQSNISRIIPWRNISAAIKAYRNKSPIKTWGFYVIY